jgi:two-component sensor histidine kinase
MGLSALQFAPLQRADHAVCDEWRKTGANRQGRAKLPFALKIGHSSQLGSSRHRTCLDFAAMNATMNPPGLDPTQSLRPGEYVGGTAPWVQVIKHWWSLAPGRPGSPWQYWLMTGAYNTVFGTLLAVVFMTLNSKATWLNTWTETVYISQCIGFTLHTLFEVFFRIAGQRFITWSKTARTAVPIAISMLGVFIGYSIAFGFQGRNFAALLIQYPRVAAGFFVIGALGCLLWFVIMDGQTRRLRAEADAARAAQQEAALTAQAAQAERHASDAELRALQAQIEPHFLFNTLAGVQALIDYEPAKAKHMLEAFIEYLRATLDASRRTQATLGDELVLMERYLSLMQVRMGERLKFEIDVPPAMRALKFAPLLVQPLVENAIKYGLEPQIDGGNLRIEGEQIGPRWQIRVLDDGAGLAAPSTARKGAGVGLINVRERAQAQLGQSAIVSVQNAPSGRGTLAFIEFDASI